MTEVSLHGATRLSIAKTHLLTCGTQVVRLIVDDENGAALEITLYVVEGKALELFIGESD